MGRFLQVDPVIGDALNGQSLNPYSYVGNNPLSGVDPTGYVVQADSCTAPTGSHICGASTAAGSSTISGHETQTDPATGKKTTTFFSGTLDGNRLTSYMITGVSNGPDSFSAKGAFSIPKDGSSANIGALDITQGVLIADNSSHGLMGAGAGMAELDAMKKLEYLQTEQGQVSEALKFMLPGYAAVTCMSEDCSLGEKISAGAVVAGPLGKSVSAELRAASAAFKDFNQARNAAIQWLETRGFKAEEATIGRLQSTKGKTIGMRTSNGKSGFRVEFDERHGAHINTWAGKEKEVFTFEGDRAGVEQLFKQFLKERQ